MIGSMLGAFEAVQLSTGPRCPGRTRAGSRGETTLLLLGRTTKYEGFGVMLVEVVVATAVVDLLPLLLPLPFARFRFLAACGCVPLPATAYVCDVVVVAVAVLPVPPPPAAA